MQKDLEIREKHNRVDIIDYLKGFAIVTIVLMHLLQGYVTELPWVILKLSSVGGNGVHAFILCSGMGLYISYKRNVCGMGIFLKRRFLKIYMPYIFIVIISFLLPWMYVGENRFGALLSHVFLYKMFAEEYMESFGVQLWFISTILQLYLLFIPMCKIKEKIKDTKIFCTIFFMVSFGWWIFIYTTGLREVRILSSCCFQYIWEFALGMGVAGVLLEKKEVRIKNGVLLLLALIGLGIQCGMSLYAEGLGVFNDIPALVGYVALALWIYNFPIIKSGVQWIAKISYEIYLIHMLVFSTIFYFFGGPGIIRQSILACMAVGVVLVLAKMYSVFCKKIGNP